MDKNLSVSNLKKIFNKMRKKSLHTFVDTCTKSKMTRFNVMC